MGSKISPAEFEPSHRNPKQHVADLNLNVPIENAPLNNSEIENTINTVSLQYADKETNNALFNNTNINNNCIYCISWWQINCCLVIILTE